MTPGDAPWLLPGRAMELPGRGTTFVRHHPAPRGAVTVLLLHGIGVTADVNWFTAYPSLAALYGVVAIDHRGHGRGIRSSAPVGLAACADDAVAGLDALGIGQAVAVGYSMGGPIAMLTWHRHRDRIAGLVLCATSQRFRGVEPVRDLGPSIVARMRGLGRPVDRRGRLDAGLRRWIASEVALTDRRSALQAGLSMSRFDASAWISDVDVPHAVVITERDAAMAPARQRRLAAALPAPTVHSVAGDHAACVTRPARFVPALLDALAAVTP